MNKLAFWQNWRKSERIIFIISLLFFTLSLFFLGFYWFYGLENVIHWDILSELDEISTVLDTFSDGQLKFTINGNAYLIKERFLASIMEVNYNANYIFLGFFFLGLNFLVSAFSSLSRYWFLGGMVLLAGVLITFHLENIFNIINQTAFLIAFAAYAGLAFFFNTFKTQLSYLKRLLCFSVLTLIGIGFLIYTSKISQPVLAIASYGLLSALALTAIFIILIAHEILAGLVWIVSNSGIKGKSSLNQFLIISSIYLLNVLLIYLEKAQYIDWNILSINPILLFVVSTLLGIWGFRNACEGYTSLNFRTAGGWIYLGLAIISTTTIGYTFATANDPLIDAIEDFIAYAHLAMGISFFLYILINFIQPFQQGLEVNKILYKPKFFELLLFRLAAIIGIFALLSFKNFNPYFQTLAGYYNTLGDFYIADNDPKAAETFYKEALHFDIRNHKSNYALASIALQADDRENTGVFLKNALEKNPSPFAYAGLSKVLQEKDMFFDALFMMKEGVNKFPENQQLLTNLAYLYEKSKVTDSTFYYLNLAKDHCTDCDVAEANILAYNLKYGKDIDKFLKTTLVPASTDLPSKTDYISYRANRTALAKLVRKEAYTFIELNQDSSLNVSQFAVLYNLASFNNPRFPYSEKQLQAIQEKGTNNIFYDDLQFARACQNYYRENKIEGLKQLSILANDSTKKKPLYNQVAGMWFLQQGVYEKALEFLTKAGDRSSVDILQKQDYKQTTKDFQQQQMFALLEKGEFNNKKVVDNAIAQAPLNPFLIEKVVEYYNKIKKGNEAYKLLFDALQLNDTSVELWRLYTLQALKIGMNEYAEDGLFKLQQQSTPADYQAFLSTYQAQKALMEKNKEGFQ